MKAWAWPRSFICIIYDFDMVAVSCPRIAVWWSWREWNRVVSWKGLFWHVQPPQGYPQQRHGNGHLDEVSSIYIKEAKHDEGVSGSKIYGLRFDSIGLEKVIQFFQAGTFQQISQLCQHELIKMDDNHVDQ